MPDVSRSRADRPTFPARSSNSPTAGFQTIELCSPVGYASSGSASSPNTKRRTTQDFGDLGVKCARLSLRYEGASGQSGGEDPWAKDMHDSNAGASLGGPRNPTIGRCEASGRRIQQMGEQAAKAGIPQGPHNGELRAHRGSTASGPMTSAGNCSIRSWSSFSSRSPLSAGGYDAAEYSRSTRGRFVRCTARLVDRDQDANGSRQGLTPTGRKSSPPQRPAASRNYFVEIEPGADEGQRSLSPRSQSLTKPVRLPPNGSGTGRDRLVSSLVRM